MTEKPDHSTYRVEAPTLFDRFRSRRTRRQSLRLLLRPLGAIRRRLRAMASA